MKSLARLIKESNSQKDIVISMPEEGVLKVWRSGDKKWLEIRGEASDKYDLEKDPDAEIVYAKDEFWQTINKLPGWAVGGGVFSSDAVRFSIKREPEIWQMFDEILKSQE